jgi:hypothetical protein
METEELPTRVNVMRVFTYDVAQIIQDLRDDNRNTEGEMEITHDDVMERIEQLAEADFAYYDVGGLIYQDQDGNDL